MTLEYNFECFVNGVTGSWTRCVRPLNFVVRKKHLGRSLVGIKLAG